MKWPFVSRKRYEELCEKHKFTHELFLVYQGVADRLLKKDSHPRSSNGRFIRKARSSRLSAADKARLTNAHLQLTNQLYAAQLIGVKP